MAAVVLVVVVDTAAVVLVVVVGTAAVVLEVVVVTGVASAATGAFVGAEVTSKKSSHSLLLLNN